MQQWEQMLMLLEIDAGNSRIKWRIGSLPGQGAASSEADIVARGTVNNADANSSVDDLLVQLEDFSVQRIVVSCVRSAAFRETLRQKLNERFSVAPEFALAQAAFGVVRNAYAHSERLGVDRWLALIAAYSAQQGACCVLDCGTTITLDVVAADGQHIGGYIVPGLQLLRAALEQRSSALQVAPVNAVPTPGNSTETAIANGVLSMALGFIRDQHKQLATTLPAPVWYLTGGDAALLASYIQWPCKLQNELVLDGLRLMMLKTGML